MRSAAETAACGTAPSARSGARSAAAVSTSSRVTTCSIATSATVWQRIRLELLLDRRQPGNDDRGNGREQEVERERRRVQRVGDDREQDERHREELTTRHGL